MAPVEGGDVRYRPLNMGELGTTDSSDAGPTNPAGDPVTTPPDPAENLWAPFPAERLQEALNAS
jgi:hypothetical protein